MSDINSLQMKNAVYYLVPLFIWSTTWFAIKLQLGSIDPVVSIAYRFTLAGILLMVVSKWRKMRLNYTFKQHFLIFLQGVTMFSLNFCICLY